MNSTRADTDGFGVLGNSRIPNIDIVTARRQIKTGTIAQSNVVATGCVVFERTGTVRRVSVASVTNERIKAAGCVVAAGCIACERQLTNGRVAAAD